MKSLGNSNYLKQNKSFFIQKNTFNISYCVL